MPESADRSVCLSRPSLALSRRQVLTAAAATAATAAATTASATEADAVTKTTRRRARTAAGGGGTPEQIHLTWGEDPARSVVVSWASPRHAVNPRVHIGQRVIMAAERRYTDGLNGETTYTYHARVQGLRPG